MLTFTDDFDKLKSSLNASANTKPRVEICDQNLMIKLIIFSYFTYHKLAFVHIVIKISFTRFIFAVQVTDSETM